MSRSPSVSAALLIERLQNDLQTLLDVAGKLAAEVSLLSAGVNTRRQLGQRYDYQGKSYTLRELARMAGLKYQTLYYRITDGGMSLEDAMAAKTGQAKPRTPPVKPEPKPGKKRKNILHAFEGEQLTLSQIAERSGLSYASLACRIRVGLTAEQAVKGTPRTVLPKEVPLQRASKPKAVTPVPAVVITAKPATLAKEAEITVPADVKRTVAETPKDRFAPDLVVPTFSAMKPGQYLDDGASPWVRSYTGPRR